MNLELFQDLFQEKLSQLNIKYNERHEIVKQIPKATSIINAVSLYYASQNKRGDIAYTAQRNFLNSLTNDEMSIIYKDMLSTSLKNAIQNSSSLSPEEKLYLQNEANSSITFIYPVFIEAFKNSISQHTPLSTRMHHDLANAVINKLAASTLFESCDVDIYSAFYNEINKQLREIRRIALDRVFIYDDFDNDYKMPTYSLDEDYMYEIYETIRNENRYSIKTILEWDDLIDANDLVEDKLFTDAIKNTVPRLVFNCIKEKINKQTNNGTLLKDSIKEFTDKFEGKLKRHADIVSNSHNSMNTNLRAKLCKNHALILTAYSRVLRVASHEFAEKQFNVFFTSDEGLEFIETKDMMSIEKENLQVKFKHGVNEKLSILFDWPQKRARDSVAGYATTTINAKKLKL